MGVCFRNDDDLEGSRAAAKACAGRTRDAHAAAMREIETALAVGGEGARSFREEVTVRANGTREAVMALTRAAETGTSADVRRACGAVFESTKAFKTCPRDPVRAVSARLMKTATLVKDACEEMGSLGEDDVDADEEDDLRFGADEFSEEEKARGEALATFGKACMTLLKGLILPTVRTKSAKLEALEPIVEECATLQNAIDDVGCGCYPPHDLEELRSSVAACASAGRKMYACVRDAEIGDDATAASLTEFEAATATVEKILQQ